MAFLDWIDNRNATQPVAKPQQPETAKTCPKESLDTPERKLARATRFMDASTRPKLAKAPETRWPRHAASWER